MRLTDLDGRLLKYVSDSEYRCDITSLSDADGVMFQCPKCAAGLPIMEEDGRRFVRGPHSVICWFVGKVPDSVNPKPGRWNPTGTGIHDITFVGPGAFSVLLTGLGCGWHGFVVNGDAS